MGTALADGDLTVRDKVEIEERNVVERTDEFNCDDVDLVEQVTGHPCRLGAEGDAVLLEVGPLGGYLRLEPGLLLELLVLLHRHVVSSSNDELVFHSQGDGADHLL